MRDRSGAMRRRGALALALCCLLGFLLSGCARVLPQAGVPQVREYPYRLHGH
ncbi:MAG: hypothetical protein IJJ45_03035 [Clostridia bacterium]|nr:hypothetical protein [Clostridia bacterium]